MAPVVTSAASVNTKSPPPRILVVDDEPTLIELVGDVVGRQIPCKLFAAKSVADRNPRANLENKFTVTTAYYAAAVRPGDFDVLQFLRTWVFLNKQNGVLATIYTKYTEVALVDLPVV